MHFYPRSPCGERLYTDSQSCCVAAISIHALLAESDIDQMQKAKEALQFLSTLSLRRATIPHPLELIIIHISIHALLAESDAVKEADKLEKSLFLSTLSLRRATLYKCYDFLDLGNFYPRSPCGERQQYFLLPFSQYYFYPRSPCGERRVYQYGTGGLTDISIHALLAESDLFSTHAAPQSLYFYPRSPCGERPSGLLPCLRSASYFYPRSPCGERLHVLGAVVDVFAISIHALLAESDTHHRTRR